MKLRVSQTHPPTNGLADWAADCTTHGHISTCTDWEWAMENAWGHIAMHHGGPRATQ